MSTITESDEITNGHADMFPRPKKQLTFELGTANEPDFGSVKFSGSLRIDRDLRHHQEVVVTVATKDGTVLATGTGLCGWPVFKDTEDKYGDVTTERIHTVSV